VLQVASLNSGSNGNCYYIGNTADAVLIDAGISCRETEKRLSRLQLNIQKIKAIFISHEHADHVMGVTKLSKKHSIPVFVTPFTQRFGKLDIEPSLVRSFQALVPITIGSLEIKPFTKFHDAGDPHSFIISCADVSSSEHRITVGVFTDIGVPCEQVTQHFAQCHAAFLETNYDDEMLEKGNYPVALKIRIRGDQGHLSNAQALQLFNEYRAPFMTHLFLSHLSQHNNKPSLVEQLFKAHAGHTEIIVASRHRETALYTISHRGEINKPVQPKKSFSYQLDLFH
jgi:phosphoribosyl 1,2-cyclic phosphodiesterase